MYGTLVDSNTYFSTLRYDRQAIWANSSEAARAACLGEATNLIDMLNFEGDKTDEEQELEFPRDGDTEVPTPIIHAAYEIAYQILSGRDVDIELENVEKVAVAFGQRRVDKEKSFVSEAKTNGIPSERAWKLLKPFLRDPHKVKIIRST